MSKTKFIAAAVAVGFALSSATAQADSRDFLGGLIIGGAVGHLATKEAQKKEAQTARVSTSNSAIIQSNREVQVALNHFGFNAGTPDGIVGNQTRSAVRSYQSEMGYPVTGRMTGGQRDVLLSSYRKSLNGTASAGSSQQTQKLMALRDDDSGAALAVPGFAAKTADASLSSHCNTVSLISQNGTLVDTTDKMTGSSLALNEQFCFARSVSIAQGETLAASISGVTPDAIEAQCETFGGSLKEHVTAVSFNPRDEVLADVKDYALQSGASPDRLASTAKVCLGSGYANDDMTTALGSALVLVAVGEQTYSELVGHHLSQGFGATTNGDLSLPWYDMSFGAIESGAEPVFDGNDDKRHIVVWAAAYEATGKQAPASFANDTKTTALFPTFNFD